MFDTLVVTLPAATLRADHKLLITESFTCQGHQANQGLTIASETGEVMDFGRVYYQDDTIAKIKSARGRIKVQFSLAKAATHGQNNIWPLSKAAAEQAIDYVQRYLSDTVGIVTNLREAVVEHCDIFSNAATEHSLVEFKPLFDTIHFGFQTRIEYKNTGYHFYSESESVVIYEKKIQQGGEGITDPNLVRVEWRNKTRQKVQTNLGITTVADLLNNYDDIQQKYLSVVKAGLRYGTQVTGTSEISGVLEELKALRQNNRGIKAFRAWLEIYGAVYLESVTGNIGALKAVLKESGFNSKQKGRLLDLVQKRLDSPIGQTGPELNSLREEFITKLTEGLS
jgi:hypothetical protein